MSTQPSKDLVTFPNPHPNRDYEIYFHCPEFTCVCPVTGQPDFATIEIRYVPDELCVELKSLKLYLWSYRDEGAYHEDVTNRILNDLVSACKPRKMTLLSKFMVRGGITTEVEVNYPDQKKSKLVNRLHEVDHRPWGHYEVLVDAPTHKVKQIVVHPGKKLSLQRHQKRNEHWLVVSGKGLFTLDDQQKEIGPGDAVFIPEKAVHRIENIGDTNFVFIETQKGEYFGEDDIERLEDDFGRVS